MALTLSAFLGMFEDFCSRRQDIDPSNYAIALHFEPGALPIEQSAYEELAREAFLKLVLRNDGHGDERFQCLEDVFRILLVRDGRTLAACVRLAELSYENPSYAAMGINSLASVASYLRTLPAGTPVDPSLRVRFERMMGNPTLFHNARECRNALIERAQVPEDVP